MFSNLLKSIIKKNSDERIKCSVLEQIARDMPFTVISLKPDCATFEPSVDGRSYLTVARQIQNCLYIGVFSNISYRRDCVPYKVREFVTRHGKYEGCAFELIENGEAVIVVVAVQISTEGLTSVDFATVVARLTVQMNWLDGSIVQDGIGTRYR